MYESCFSCETGKFFDTVHEKACGRCVGSLNKLVGVVPVARNGQSIAGSCFFNDSSRTDANCSRQRNHRISVSVQTKIKLPSHNPSIKVRSCNSDRRDRRVCWCSDLDHAADQGKHEAIVRNIRLLLRCQWSRVVAELIPRVSAAAADLRGRQVGQCQKSSTQTTASEMVNPIFRLLQRPGHARAVDPLRSLTFRLELRLQHVAILIQQRIQANR